MNRRTPFVALAFCCLLLLPAAHVFAQEVSLGGARPKITTASAVRARTSPEVAAGEMTRLKLGALVNAVARTAEQSEAGGRKDYWYRVELPGGVSGWVFGGLLADYDPARRGEIVRRIIGERMKVEAMSFDDGVDLYNFVSAALAETTGPAARGELELLRLHALGRAVGPMPHDAQERPPYRDFHREHEREIYHHEMAGVWAVRPELFWELERRHRGTAVGERIAWDASQALRGGECEGDAVCHFLSLQETEGKYLSLYPQGGHASEVLQNLSQALTAEQLTETLKSKSSDKYIVEDRARLRKALTELRAAVALTTAPEKASVLKALEQLSAAKP